jgi:hypothetical protein
MSTAQTFSAAISDRGTDERTRAMVRNWIAGQGDSAPAVPIAAGHADMLIGTFPDFVPTDISEGTVNGVLGESKVQFLDASPQHRLVEAPLLAGLRVAGVEDIMAMKIQVVMDRGELRDYFDLMCIEKQTDLDVAEGMTLYLERYRPTTPEQHILQAVRALGYFDDVPDDPGLPLGRSEIERYWTARQPCIINELNLG